MRPTFATSLVLQSLALLVTLLACAGGCTTGEYGAEYESRVQDFRRDAVFAVLAGQATDVADGRLRMRLPMDLGPQAEDDGTKIRQKPPFVRDFPGFAAAYEKNVTKGNMRLPAVLTVGFVPSAEQRHAAVEAAILEQVRRDESFRKADWQRGRAVEPAAAGPAVWDVLVLKGQQEFESIVAETSEYKKWPGLCEIWVSADPKQDQCTVLALRVPDEIADALPVPPEQLIELVARTVHAVPPPDEEPVADPPRGK